MPQTNIDAGYRSSARESACDPGGGAALAESGLFLRAEVQLQSNAGGAEWLFVFDRASALEAGTIPLVPPVKVEVGSTSVINHEVGGVRFTSGLRVALSTSDTFAASSSAKGLFVVKFLRG